MGQRITIEIKNKVATCLTDEPIVCGNSDYEVEFLFDAEWNEHNVKTAMFVTRGESIEQVFEGNICKMPIILDTLVLWVGVFAGTINDGTLDTSSPALVHCVPCIIGGKNIPPLPKYDVYNQIVGMCEDAVKTANSVEERANKGEFNGDDGLTPYIKNDTWWIGENDTGVKARAEGGTSDIEVVQTTGDSETAVMSQKAVTEALKNIGGSEAITNIPNVIDDCQSTNGWNAVTLANLTASLQADTTDFLYGSQSVRFTGCIQKHNLGIKVADGELRIKFKINSIDDGAAFVLMASDDSNFTNFTSWTLFDASIIEHRNTNLIAKVGEWTEMALPWAGLENISVLEKVSIFNTLRFRFLNGNGDANVQMIMTQPTKEPRGLLTITFDDGCKAQYTKAAKILGERGLKATAYIIPDIVGVSEGCMTEEQLVSLKYDYGWDIQGHWGEEMSGYTEERLKTSFQSVKTWLKEHGLGDCEHFAYAGGMHDYPIEKIARNYFKTARTIAGSQTRGITSTKITNPYRLASISSVSDTSNMSGFNAILDRITRISKCGGWLILTFHDIGDTATAMFCSEAGFAQLLDHAISCGIDIKTMAEAMRGSV